jgi:hypothetical protein
MNKKVSEQEIFDYLVKMEKVNEEQCGKKGIFPVTRQVELVFGISKERANYYINEIQKRHRKNFRLNPVSKISKIIKIRK